MAQSATPNGHALVFDGLWFTARGQIALLPSSVQNEDVCCNETQCRSHELIASMSNNIQRLIQVHHCNINTSRIIVPALWWMHTRCGFVRCVLQRKNRTAISPSFIYTICSSTSNSSLLHIKLTSTHLLMHPSTPPQASSTASLCLWHSS